MNDQDELDAEELKDRLRRIVRLAVRQVALEANMRAAQRASREWKEKMRQNRLSLEAELHGCRAATGGDGLSPSHGGQIGAVNEVGPGGCHIPRAWPPCPGAQPKAGRFRALDRCATCAAPCRR